MNIQVQTCGLIIISLIMFFFFTNKKIGLFTEKVFSRILIGSFFCLCLDIFSIVFIVYENSVPHFLTAFVCKSYLVSLLWMGFSGFDYIMTDLMSEKRYHGMVHYFIAMTILESIGILCAPVYWYREGRIVYSYGLSTTLTYVFTFIFIVTTTIILFVKARRLNARRRVAMSLWMAMWFGAALIQFIFNEFLLVGFAIAMGMATLFFMLENPESLQDRRCGCFNSHALLLFLRQVYDRKESYGILDFNFMDSGTDANRQSVLDNAFDVVVGFLEKYRSISIYKNVENEIVAFSKDATLLRQVVEDFKEVVISYYSYELNFEGGVFPSMNLMVIEDSSKLDSVDNLFGLLARTRGKLPTYKGLQIGYIDDGDIEELYHYNEVKNEISNAIAEDRVEVFYQPIYSLGEERYISCEALARIRRTDGSLLSPGEFIPIAEETGLIVSLGERVFLKVCEFLNRNKEAEQLKYVEVNLSIAQFEVKDLADRFIRIMKEYGVKASQINLEITESTSIKGKSSLLKNIEQFLDYGISFSLDDFGKGESNLMYVVEMPISIVKLDMDMIKAYFVEPKARFVLAATVQMAHELGLRVVAEGIEFIEELEVMKKESVDFIQGFYYSKPVPENEFITKLQNNK